MVFASGCLGGNTSKEDSTKTIVLYAYSVPRDALQKEIIPGFKKYWKDKTGETVEFQESYAGSGTQVQAILGGAPADVALLSLDPHVTKLKDAGLVTTDWHKFPHQGIITRSIVVLITREGNPKNIKDFEDLTDEDVEVLHANPVTSGGAMWTIFAIYGSALKKTEIDTGVANETLARDLLKRINKNVKIMPKSAREATIRFDNGIGDVLITYENEALLKLMQGAKYEIVIPKSTILIENPVVIVDKNVDKHGNREVVEEFVNFLWTEESQRAFADLGYRSVNDSINSEYMKYSEVEHLFNISYLGGWSTAPDKIINGVWKQIQTGLD